MDGNPHAHNMETDGMDDWTKKEDIEAAQRCPDRCPMPGCNKPAQMAFSFIYHTWSMPRNGTRTLKVVGTHWQYVCNACGDLMNYDDVLEHPGEGKELFKAMTTGV